MKKNQLLIGALCMSFLFSCGSAATESTVEATAIATEKPVEEEKQPVEDVAAPSSVNEQFVVNFDKNFGPITANMDKEALINAFGKENVSIEKGSFEGSEYTTTRVFKGTNNEIEVIWENEATMNKIAYVQFFSLEGKSDWQFPEGIHIGTPLSKIQEVNGQPFKMSAFHGAEGSGFSESWDGGQIPEGVTFGFDEPADYKNMAEALKVDDYISSDVVLENKEDPTVRWITVGLK